MNFAGDDLPIATLLGIAVLDFIGDDLPESIGDNLPNPLGMYIFILRWG